MHDRIGACPSGQALFYVRPYARIWASEVAVVSRGRLCLHAR